VPVLSCGGHYSVLCTRFLLKHCGRQPTPSTVLEILQSKPDSNLHGQSRSPIFQLSYTVNEYLAPESNFSHIRLLRDTYVAPGGLSEFAKKDRKTQGLNWVGSRQRPNVLEADLYSPKTGSLNASAIYHRLAIRIGTRPPRQAILHQARYDAAPQASSWCLILKLSEALLFVSSQCSYAV